jgi:hypothetical protein
LAVSRPMPLLPPVTIAVFPVSFMSGFLRFVVRNEYAERFGVDHPAERPLVNRRLPCNYERRAYKSPVRRMTYAWSS